VYWQWRDPFSPVSDVMNASSTLDCWSLDSWFSGFNQPDYAVFKEDLIKDVTALLTRVPAARNNADALAGILPEWELLQDRLGHLGAYLGCLSAADATNEAVQVEEAWFSTLNAESSKIRTLVQAALAQLDETAWAHLLEDTRLRQAEHAVRRMREAGRQQMTTEMEALAADLNVTGLHAWGRLYDTLSGRMTFPMTFPDGHTESVPMARRRALMSEPDRRLREAAFHAGQKPWQDQAITLAASLNGIAGTRLGLDPQRGRSHFLEEPLFDGALTRASLEAMMEAIHTHIELPRRALRHAATLQGTPALHFFDLEAPQIAAPQTAALTWDQACTTVEQSFSAAYPKLGTYFREILSHRWIEAQARSGKRPGAFCTGSRLRREERIYMTFHGTMHDMVTLAHEAGHAWHSCVLRPQRSWAADYPMTLAETASNFGEMILLTGLMADPNLPEGMKAHLLDQEMLRAHANLINIPMRYEFEKAFYTERRSGEVTPSRLNELMSEAQEKLYGNTLLANGTDPLFWASKMHFFITGVSFYNFPYVFGYLLSQALFARFKAEGPAFLPHYESFLASTGGATCEEVVKQTLGEDLTDTRFWARAVKSMEPALIAYEATTAAR
jgi:oligoendopeptidase F